MNLSNHSRTRAIALVRVKLDRPDAGTMAYLLRGDLVAERYVPPRKNRERRTLIRHHASLTKMRVEGNWIPRVNMTCPTISQIYSVRKAWNGFPAWTFQPPQRIARRAGDFHRQRNYLVQQKLDLKHRVRNLGVLDKMLRYDP